MMIMRAQTVQPGEGERLHAKRRHQAWRIMAGLALVGLIGGLVAGSAGGIVDAGKALPEWASTAAGGIIVLTAILGAYGSWRYFVTVDELELVDNLWASLGGFAAYSFTFPTWWMLHRIGEAPEPDGWTIFTVSMVTMMLVYGLRKWRAR